MGYVCRGIVRPARVIMRKHAMRRIAHRVVGWGLISFWTGAFGAQAAEPLLPSGSQAGKLDLPALRWETLGRSPENRVIEYAQFGTGSRQVLVVGPLAGDRP